MAEKIKYQMSTWKLIVEGEFESEEEAIEQLSHEYMIRSKCDAPGDHPLELITNSKVRSGVENIAKHVYFYIYEKVYGNMQKIMKYQLNIHPFKKEHWWPCEGFEFEECEFKYKIKEND